MNTIFLLQDFEYSTLSTAEQTEQDLYLQAAAWVEKLAAGELDSLSKRRFSHWLDADPRHRELLLSMLQTWQDPALTKALAAYQPHPLKRWQFSLSRSHLAGTAIFPRAVSLTAVACSAVLAVALYLGHGSLFHTAAPYELKTAAGRATIAADEFFWQDYLGKDYALKAFQFARQYGNATDIHFINDYNLEYSMDKCKGLIEYVKYIESKGAKVDGIGTQMHISTTSDKAKIEEMFRLLAATGKLIKVSELDMGINNKKTTAITEEDLKVQEAMYKFVVEKYFEIIPAAQRYGITIWSPLDSPVNSFWRAGEPIGLWTEGMIRKPSYMGVAEGLKNK